jgi:hypothetical protein
MTQTARRSSSIPDSATGLRIAARGLPIGASVDRQVGTDSTLLWETYQCTLHMC